MTNEEFTKCVDRRLALIRETLVSKGQEYATGTDRLHNFNATAAMNRTSREIALWGMASKHVTSVIDMVKDTESGIYPTAERIDEKIGDFIVYGILLEACFVDSLEAVKVPRSPIEPARRETARRVMTELKEVAKKIRESGGTPFGDPKEAEKLLGQEARPMDLVSRKISELP